MERSVDSSSGRSLVSTVGRPAIVKVLVMGLSGLLGVFTSRLIISHFGVDAYAQYGLLTSFPALLPFADLGIASVIFNVVAGSSDPRRDPQVQRTLTTAFRVLLVSAGVIVAVAVAITVLGLWPTLLGRALLEPRGLVPMVCLMIFGLGLPLTVGQRVLVGLGRTTTQVAVQAVVAPFMLGSVGLLVVLAVPASDELAVLSYLAGGLVSVISLIIAARTVRPMIGAAVRDVPRLRAVRGVTVLDVAWPMLVQMLALPIAMQTDRLLLSHLTTGDELAQYNLGSQLFTMVTQAIAAGGIALWPVYARARSVGQIRSPLKPSLVFMLAGLGIAGVLALLSPYIVGFVSDGSLTLDPWLIGGFLMFVSVQAAKYPIGMYMTDKRGLRFQVIPILILVPLNLGLSWWLIGVVGAAGPILGSAIAVLACQVIPNLWYIRRDLRLRRAQVAAAATGGV